MELIYCFSVTIFVVLIALECNSKDEDLLLLSHSGLRYTTDGSQCPFGSYFYKGPEDVDCVCSKGLWLFYKNSCGHPVFMQGSENMTCTAIDFQLKKSLMISKTMEPSLSILHPRHGISMKLFINLNDEPFKLKEHELIVTNGLWTLELKENREGTIGQKGSICVYDSREVMGATIESVLTGNVHAKGRKKMRKFEPLICTEIPRSPNPDDTSCSKNAIRLKRSANDYYRSRRNPQEMKGRAFLPTILAMNEEFAKRYNASISDGPGGNGTGGGGGENGTGSEGGGNGTYSGPIVADEDLENVTRDGNIIIKSQIWNYLTEKATDIMGLLEIDPRQSTTIRIPAFRFLEICKKILAKRCPSHYVSKEHLDLSVAVFRAIQLRDMLYEEPSIEHGQVERILRSLQLCEEKTNETFPFVQVNVSCNMSDMQAPGVLMTENPLDTVGRFYMFEQELYMDVPWAMSPANREPIIDTVWNIYLHAHSHCFEYFNESSFNDHHKFSTIMMSMFTNGILDIWTELSELKPDIYSGFLGDAVVLMQRVVHCAASGRIENGTTYPWDLQRPMGRNNATNNATAGAGGESPPSGGRKKRHATPVFDANPQSYLGCINNIDENSYICTQ